jgi:hypothetical protein
MPACQEGVQLVSEPLTLVLLETYLRESSPPRPNVDGVENELPKFHRLAKYPTELDSECPTDADS